MMERSFAAWLALAAVSLPVATAQTTAFEGRTITEIDFAPRQPLHPADLARALSIKKGGALHAADVADSIDKLFATGRFEDIVVEAEPSGTGVRIQFVTQLAWFVGHVAVRGRVSPPPNRAQIVSADQLSLGAPFHDPDLAAAVGSIQHLLRANGFYEAQVSPDVQRKPQTQEVYVTFTVRQRDRAKYEMPIIHGARTLSNSAVVRATGWRLPVVHWWRSVTEARTGGGVEGVLRAYEKQQRLAAEGTISKLDWDSQRNRVRPTLNLNPGPRIQVTSVETKVPQRILKRYVPVFQERALYNDLLVEGKRNLEDYFQSKGYFDASVDFRILPRQNDLQKVEYVIARGAHFNLVRLDIRGNRYFKTDDIRQRLFMRPASFTFRHGRFSEAFRRKDEENIKSLYQANGFRDVKVTTTVDRNYRKKRGNVAVTIHIDEGPQWLVDNLKIEGVAQVDKADLVSGMASSAGEPFADANVANDRNYILNYYYARGFPDADFEVTWTPSDPSHHVNVVYTIHEGDRQYVRDVLISGLSKTRQSLVNRTLRIRAGDPLSPTEQLNAQQRLYDLGVFARVDTAVQNPDGSETHKYLLYSLEEANRWRMAIGFGLQVANFGQPSTTTLAAPGGTPGISPQVSLDLQRLNVLGLGHTITFRGAYSTLEQLASLSYLQPRLFGRRNTDITYSLLYDNTLNVRTFAARREQASVVVSNRFSKSLTGNVGFAYRRVSVSSIVIPVLLIPQFVEPVRIGMLSASLIQDRRNSPDNPSRGMYNTANVGISANFFGSQRSFSRILLRNATYYHLRGQWIFARQTQFGVISPFNVPANLIPNQSVPLPERFYGGGADSMRGFAYNQAGPRDIGAPLSPGGASSSPTGFPIGGNALLFNTLELRFPLIAPNVQGVLFYDVGNVYTSLRDISFRFHQPSLVNFNYMVQAPGFGVRYRTPIGPIRADVAYAINPPSFLGFSGTPSQLLNCNPNLPPSSLPSYCQPTFQTLRHIQFFFSIGQTF
jgi:outer membrane protein assembly complex protein YaeT